VAFPAIAATDNGPTAPVVTCWAPGATPSSLNYAAGVAAAFPLGNTTVTCRATDGAGLVSANATFRVAVLCAAGFVANGSACAGEREAWGGGAEGGGSGV
jgi:hypothetical protein